MAKSLIIFMSIGVIAAFTFGIYLIDVKNTNQLVFVEGPSISIVTEKFDFKKYENIKIRVVNSGSTPLLFSNDSNSFRITGLSGILMYSPISEQMISQLEPGDEIEFSWDQIKDNGDAVLEGLYKISVKAVDEQGNNVERSTIVTIWK